MDRTATALARFDGEAFKVIGKREGLDVGTGINDLQFDRQGHLWIATNRSGVFRLDLTTADAGGRLQQFLVGQARPSNRVNTFRLMADGGLWTGTDAGLFLGNHGFRRLRTSRSAHRHAVAGFAARAHHRDAWRRCVARHECRRLSMSSSRGLGVRSVIEDAANSMLIDSGDRLWLGTRDGVKVWRLNHGAPSGPPESIADGNILRLSPASNGATLAATHDGRAILIENGRAEVIFETDTSPIYDLIEDAAQNLWVSTRRGLVSIRRQGVRLFTARHGLQRPNVRGLARDAHGHIYALTEDFWLHRVDRNQLTPVRLVLPPGVRRSSWLGSGFHVDASGDVWLGTADGLCRYRGVRFSPGQPREYRPSNVYTLADGLAGNYISEVFEDSHGDLWISSTPVGPTSVTIRRRHTGEFERLDASRGLPPFNQPARFVETTPGTLWAALREGGAVRIRDGHAHVFGHAEGLPPLVSLILSDRGGRVWMGGPDGIVRIADPTAEMIRAEPIAAGLPSGPLAMALGGAGAIFIGTQQGLFAIDERSGTARPLSSLEGLPAGGVDTLLAAPDGTLLLTAGASLARVDPSVRARAPRQIHCLIGGLHVGPRALSLPEGGVDRFEGLEVPPARNSVAIDFLAVSPYIGDPLSYEHRLAEVSEEWSHTTGRRVTLAGLGSGRYTFEVRARASDGTVSAPATIRFRVLPPWYRRWWFLSICAAAVAGLAYAGHRARLSRAIYAEQLRSRIATDLHDDLGASLSQIAVFSEVLRTRRSGLSGHEADGILEKIGTTSRELVSSMSDIVWAVNPRYDSLGDLVARMRRFAEDTFAQSHTAFEFSAPAIDHLRLGPAAKREMLLILKEGVTNIVKHAQARRASVSLAVRGRHLTLRVCDDGQGFDPDATHAGNGIRSLRRRVAALGGTLTMVSAPDRGTEIVLDLDIH